MMMISYFGFSRRSSSRPPLADQCHGRYPVGADVLAVTARRSPGHRGFLAVAIDQQDVLAAARRQHGEV